MLAIGRRLMGRFEVENKKDIEGIMCERIPKDFYHF